MKFRVVLQSKVTYEKIVMVEADSVVNAMEIAEADDGRSQLMGGSISGHTGYAVRSIDELK